MSTPEPVICQTPTGKNRCGHPEDFHSKSYPFECMDAFCPCAKFNPLRADDVIPEEMRPASKAIQKWADSAMFEAEPIDANEGPQVYLLSMTPDPLGSIAAACKMYKGEVVRSLADVTDEERIEYFEQVQKTKLQAPFEFVQFHFMIEGVTRAFTHQMVRQRTATYAQESLRFAVKEDMPVGLPPSLAGTQAVWRDHEFEACKNLSLEPGDQDVEIEVASRMVLESDAERQRWQWDKTLEHVDASYSNLVGSGMPAEDARGLLPHNVLTRLHYTTNLRNLLDHAGNRLCTQAQFEWRLVFSRITEAIRAAARPPGAPRVTMHFGNLTPHNSIERHPIYMADKIANLFRPVCYQTGKCEFKANFDRKCSIRERVDLNEAVRRPSSEWDEDYDPEAVHLGGPYGQAYGSEPIPAIAPYEWLADPGAAR